MNKPEPPICQICGHPVEHFKWGSFLRRGTVCFFEAECHKDKERLEYWPVKKEASLFFPKSAFPMERPLDGTAKYDCPAGPLSAPDIQNELLQMPEWTRIAKVRHFEISVRLFESNADELEHFLSYLTEDQSSFHLADVKNQAKLDQAFEEVLRLLHNFVSAAKTLVEHTRVMYKDLYEKEKEFPDFEEKKKQLTDIPVIQFVQRLRNLAQHVRLPHLSLVTDYDVNRGIDRRILLKKTDLFQLGDWNKQAKEFLQSQPDLIDLSLVVQDYRTQIHDFYSWMAKRQQDIHGSDQSAIRAKQEEGLLILKKEIPSSMEVGLDSV